MKSLTREEFLRVFGMTPGTFDVMQHAGHIALAFGVPLPATPGRYLDLDLVAMAIASTMTPTVGRENATTIVLGFFHQWVAAVGRADADKTESFHFAVGQVQDAMGRPVEYLISSGTRLELAHDFEGMRGAVMAVDISDILARLRAKARAASINLDGAFFPPPNDPRFGELIAEARQIRDERLARLKQDKKKYSIHKKRAKRKDIKPVPTKVKDDARWFV